MLSLLLSRGAEPLSRELPLLLSREAEPLSRELPLLSRDGAAVVRLAMVVRLLRELLLLRVVRMLLSRGALASRAGFLGPLVVIVVTSYEPLGM